MDAIRQARTLSDFKTLLEMLRGEQGQALAPAAFNAKHCDGTTYQLSKDRYIDNAVFERERERLFHRYPVVIGHASELQDGQVMTHDALGVPLIITRHGDQLSVFLNQCRHRGTRLLDQAEACKRSSIVCPYHHWVYGLNGDLRSYPQPEGFPDLIESDRGLIPFPSAIRNGLMWVQLDRSRPMDLDEFLDDMPAYLDELNTKDYVLFRRSSKTWNCNWKLPIDAFLEAYHLHRLHRHTLAPLFQDNIANIQAVGMHRSAAVARAGVEQAFDQAEDEWDLRNLVTFTHYLLPNTVIIYHPDYTSVVSFYPQSANRTIIDHSMLIPSEPKNDKERGHWERAFEMTDKVSFGDEDFTIAVQMQSGLEAGGQDHILLGNYEMYIRDFHEQVEAMMDAP